MDSNERILPDPADDAAFQSSFGSQASADNKSFLDAVAEQKSDARPVQLQLGLDLGNIFSYHPPKDGQGERYEAIRAKGLEMAQLIAGSTPSSAEQTLAIRKIQEAVMWANANIACNE